MQKLYCVYIVTNKNNTTLYVGFSSNLPGRVYQHTTKAVLGFTAHYNLGKLVYFEVFDDPTTAIMREKQLKAGSRQKKVDLIKKENPKWVDLSGRL